MINSLDGFRERLIDNDRVNHVQSDQVVEQKILRPSTHSPNKYRDARQYNKKQLFPNALVDFGLNNSFGVFQEKSLTNDRVNRVQNDQIAEYRILRPSTYYLNKYRDARQYNRRNLKI